MVGGFLAFVGAFGTVHQPFMGRVSMMLPVSIAGALTGMLCFRLACRIPGTGDRRWLQGVIGGVMMTPPMTVFIWAFSNGLGDRAPWTQLPQYAPVTFVTCMAMTLLAVGFNRHAYFARVAAAPPPPPPPAPVKFLERLPVKLRGAEIWAVEAEDHYLRLHTSRGQDLILFRLADAVDELQGLEGAQVHRSWWVARGAVADARRGDGRAVLTLKDGTEVPVSRTYAPIIRDKGWL